MTDASASACSSSEISCEKISMSPSSRSCAIFILSAWTRGWNCPFSLRCVEKYTFSILTKFDAGTKSNQDIVFVGTQPGIHHVQKTFSRAQRHPICKVVTLYKYPTLFSHKCNERTRAFSSTVLLPIPLWTTLHLRRATQPDLTLRS